MYLKWVFEDSLKDEKRPLKIDDITVCDTWDPNNSDWDKRGGFNFSTEESILRWVSRGDTLCEVELPIDAEVKTVENQKTPNGILVSNKIILRNPIPVSDDLTMKYYQKSNMPLKTYFETIAALAIRGCYQTCLEIIKDKVNMDTIEEAIYEYTNFIKPWHKDNMNQEIYDKVLEILLEIKSDILINLFVDKDPYQKTISNDRIINLTGQSGSGKTTYASQFFNTDDYFVIDTDDIFSDERFKISTGINHQLGDYFRKKYDVLPNCGDDFDLIYKEILDFCQQYDKTIVIDCAQFHCIKDIRLLKGKLIVLRTSINHCYNRTIDRYKKLHPNCTNTELENYQQRKKAIFKWYKFSNQFIKNVDDYYS